MDILYKPLNYGPNKGFPANLSVYILTKKIDLKHQKETQRIHLKRSNMSNIEYNKTGQTTTIRNGTVLNNATHSYSVKIAKEANTQGTRLLKLKNITNVMSAIISSKTDSEIFSYLLQNSKTHNLVCKLSSQDPATASYLATHLDVSVQKIRSFIRKATDAQFIARVKGKLYISPYILIPYTRGKSSTVNDQIANQLQVWWDSPKESSPDNIITMDTDELIQESIGSFIAQD